MDLRQTKGEKNQGRKCQELRTSPLSFVLSKLYSSPLNFIQHKSFLRNYVNDMQVYSYFSLSTDKCDNNLLYHTNWTSLFVFMVWTLFISYWNPWFRYFSGIEVITTYLPSSFVEKWALQAKEGGSQFRTFLPIDQEPHFSNRNTKVCTLLKAASCPVRVHFLEVD